MFSNPLATIPYHDGHDLLLTEDARDLLSYDIGAFNGNLLANVYRDGVVLGEVDLGEHGTMFGIWRLSGQKADVDVQMATSGMPEEQAERYQVAYANTRTYSFARVGEDPVFQNHTEVWGARSIGARTAPLITDIVGDPWKEKPPTGSELRAVDIFSSKFQQALDSGDSDWVTDVLSRMGYPHVEPELSDDVIEFLQGEEPALDADVATERFPGLVELEESVGPAHTFIAMPDGEPRLLIIGGWQAGHLQKVERLTKQVEARFATLWRGSVYMSQTVDQLEKLRAGLEAYRPMADHLIAQLRRKGYHPTGVYGYCVRVSGFDKEPQVVNGMLVGMATVKGVLDPDWSYIQIGFLVVEVPRFGSDFDWIVAHSWTSPAYGTHSALTGGIVPIDMSAYPMTVNGEPALWRHTDSQWRFTSVPARKDGMGFPYGWTFHPLVGGLGPVEQSLVIGDIDVGLVLVGTSKKGPVDWDGAGPRPSEELTPESLSPTENPSTGYRDVVYAKTRMRVERVWQRVGAEALAFITDGAGVVKPFPQKAKDSYMALAAELGGNHLTMVDLREAWRAPHDAVLQLEVARRHRKAREKACKRDNFLSLRYTEQLTWGQANIALNRDPVIRTAFAVDWATAVKPLPKEPKPKEIILHSATDTTSAYAEIKHADGKLERVEPGDYDKLGFHIKDGVPWKGSLDVIKQGAGLDVDFDPDIDRTVLDTSFWGTAQSASFAGVGGDVPTAFGPEAYAQAGFADLHHMSRDDQLKAAIASRALFTAVGSQLQLAFKKLRKDMPAAVKARGRRVLATRK